MRSVILAIALGPLGPVVGLERVDRLHCVVAVLGVVDLGEHGFRAWVPRLRKGGNNVRADEEPAPLLSGIGAHLPQGRLEPRRTVTDREYRCGYPAPAAGPQQPSPRLAGFAKPIAKSHQFLAGVGAQPDHHQQAHSNPFVKCRIR
jgi:hypothetical protein